MKGLKTLTLISIISAASASNAELIDMDDNTLSTMTGQAGITLDIDETLITIGAIDYQDEGFLSIQDVKLTDADLSSAMDNIRITIDVAGSSGADLGTPDLGSQAITASGGTVTNLVEENQNAKVSDGDLIIAIRAQDSSQPLDFGFTVGSIELGHSGSTVGEVSGGTVIAQNWTAAGSLAGVDIIFDNGNDGFNLSVLFNAQGEITLPFINTYLKFNMHNNRGQSTVIRGAESFAHLQLNAKKGEVSPGVDAIALDIQDLSGDIDITDIQFGNNGLSIGNIYITDLQLVAETITYGH